MLNRFELNMNPIKVVWRKDIAFSRTSNQWFYDKNRFWYKWHNLWFQFIKLILWVVKMCYDSNFFSFFDATNLSQFRIFFSSLREYKERSEKKPHHKIISRTKGLGLNNAVVIVTIRFVYIFVWVSLFVWTHKMNTFFACSLYLFRLIIVEMRKE